MRSAVLVPSGKPQDELVAVSACSVQCDKAEFAQRARGTNSRHLRERA